MEKREALENLKKQNEYWKKKGVKEEYRYDEEIAILEKTVKESEKNAQILDILGKRIGKNIKVEGAYIYVLDEYGKTVDYHAISLEEEKVIKEWKEGLVK